MADSISVHIIHAADAPQHLEHLTKILQVFKTENRIDKYSSIDHNLVTDRTFESLEEDDMVITLLTKGLIGLQGGIEEILLELRYQRPKYKMVEVIIDNIPFHSDFIALPTSLEPIRDSEDMNGVWNDIGSTLREIFSVRTKVEPPPIWKKYIPYAVGFLLLIGIGFGIWKSDILTVDPKAAFSHKVLDPVNGEIVVEGEECYVPCQVLLNNKSEDADSIVWQLNDDTEIKYEDEPIHVYLKPGKYDMKLLASSGDKQNVKTKTLKVKALPFANFEIIGNGCKAPCDIGFKNTSKAATKYSWSFNGVSNNTDSIENPSKRHFENEGKFNVTHVVENEDGVKTDTIQEVTILKDNTPFAEFKAQKIAGGNAPQQRFRFENTSKNGTAFVWNFGDQTPNTTLSDTRVVNHDFKAYGTYMVSLKVIGLGGVTREIIQPVRVVGSKWEIGPIRVYDANIFKEVIKAAQKSVNLTVEQ